jgi:hypothetical protein
MPIDPSIPLGVKPPQIETPMNAMLQMTQMQGAQQQNALMGLKMQQAQQDQSERDAIRTTITGLPASATDEQRIAALRGSGTQAGFTMADTLETSLMNRKKTEATAAKDQVEAAHQRAELLGSGSAWLRQNPTPENALALAQHFHDSGLITPEQLQASVARIKADPSPQAITQAADMAYRMALSVKDQLPKIETQSTGGALTTQTVDPVTGKPTVTGSTPMTATPGEVITDARARQQMAQSATQHAETLKKDYAIAGLNPDGTATGVNDSMVDAIGQYKIAPPNGMALRNPRMQQILAQVAEKYPDFDATQYGARQQAAKAFSTGKDGQAVQSANTALNHLGTLRELAAAQNNGDVRLFNTLANRFATETGGTAPSNLAAAVTLVGPEISKAVIGAGGTGGDREKVDAALAALTKGGKAQAAGVLATMEDLFGGRLTETQRTYERTTGRKDFAQTFLSPAAQRVLAARTQSSAPQSGGAPLVNAQGWTLHTDAKGNRAYVSPDGKQFQAVK